MSARPDWMPRSRIPAPAARSTSWRAIRPPTNCAASCKSAVGSSISGKSNRGASLMSEATKNSGMVLKIGHLYPTLMSVAADRGNLFSIQKRCQWRGIANEVEPIYVKQTPDFTKYDLILCHGAADREMELASRDIQLKASSLREAVDSNTVV